MAHRMDGRLHHGVCRALHEDMVVADHRAGSPSTRSSYHSTRSGLWTTSVGVTHGKLAMRRRPASCLLASSKVVGEGNKKTVVYDDEEPFHDSMIPYKRFKGD